MEFFEASAHFSETCFMAANRVGKTEAGAYAVACHATGIYPKWWKGKKFASPTNILVAGENAKLVRDTVQKKLMGEIGAFGSGMIPLDKIKDYRPKAGVPDAVDTVYIKHKSGGQSIIQFQSFDQGRESFQGTERHVIWLDEECPISIYTEALMRTMTTRGIVFMTFTPMKGVTDTVLGIQAKAALGNAAVVQATWDDCGHLTEEDKKRYMDSLPPHQREARSKGIPQLGSGAIYPIIETDIIIDPFQIPPFYKRCYGLDVGWNNTAAVWMAWNEDTDTMYITDEYKRGQAEPSVHSSAILARGSWIPGVIDPASRGRQQADGEQLLKLYRDGGLNLSLADNTVEAGIFDVYKRFTTGRLKIFSSCRELLSEYRLYRRDEKGKVVKENDHLMDAMRYVVRTGVGTAEYNHQQAMDSLEKKTNQHQSHYNPLDRGYVSKEITGGINRS